jgi:polyisoprenoid-binding protein YceI
MVLGIATLFAANYKVDTAHSSIGFKVRHMVVSNTKGVFEKFSGSYSYDPAAKQLNALEGTVEVASVDTRDVKRDKHLRSADFFDVATYPTMTMKLIKHSGDEATFDLTIKATTKRVTFEVEDLSGEIKDPWGNYRTGMVIEGKIDRKDFGIDFHKVMDTGGFVVGDTVKISIELEGIKG